MKKRKFNPVNFIPNQSDYQREFLNESFEKELPQMNVKENYY